MPKRLSDDVRSAIVATIKQGGLSTRQIGKLHDVSDATVRRIAKDENITDAWSRDNTEKATRASVADNRAVRAITSRRFLDRANWFLDQMDEPYTVFAFGGKDNDYNEHLLNRPPIPELRSLMTAAATAFDKHLVADRHDSGARTESAKSLIGSIAAGLNAAYEQLPDEPADDQS